MHHCGSAWSNSQCYSFLILADLKTPHYMRLICSFSIETPFDSTPWAEPVETAIWTSHGPSGAG
jgi:hypothetical protein